MSKLVLGFICFCAVFLYGCQSCMAPSFVPPPAGMDAGAPSPQSCCDASIPDDAGVFCGGLPPSPINPPPPPAVIIDDVDAEYFEHLC